MLLITASPATQITEFIGIRFYLVILAAIHALILNVNIAAFPLVYKFALDVCLIMNQVGTYPSNVKPATKTQQDLAWR